MRRKESYRSFATAAFGLTLTIIITFQLYIWREPARIAADEGDDHIRAVAEGSVLYAKNCAACHGDSGEGAVGPALNSKELLVSASDDALVYLTKAGIPGTLMPAWDQDFGGPLTDEQVAQVITYIRSWEPTAPVIEPEAEAPDPIRGATIYAQTCVICHGDNGQGTQRAPALNDHERLSSLDNSWYRSTISRGRPAKGMPTWGTVLSPSQIGDLVALIEAWRDGQEVSADFPLATLVTNALFAIREFDQPDAIFFLNASLSLADENQRSELESVITMVRENQLFEAERLLVSLLPPEQMGRALYSSNCAPCHGDDGTGGMGPALWQNAFVNSQSDDELIEMILTGRPGTAMDGFESILSPDELINLVALLRSWQE